MKNVKRVVLSFLVVLGLVASSTQAMTVQAATTSPQVDAKAGLAVDANSGQILYQQNANQVRPIG